jgi:ferredoxin-NADP reductase
MEKPFTEAADDVAAGIGLIRDGAPAAMKAPAPGVAHPCVVAVTGNAVDAASRDERLRAGRDIHAAGPAPMLRALSVGLDRLGIARERVQFDAFGV